MKLGSLSNILKIEGQQKVTANHRYWVVGGNQFVEADHLKPS